MATDEKTQKSGSNGVISETIAWPGRLLSAFLGPPSSPSCSTLNSRMRYRACQACARSIGPINVVANVFLTLIKGYLGIIGRSTALIADAIHSVADVVSSIMLLFGLRIAQRPANNDYPYGYGKIEFLVALVIYTSLIAAGVVIFIEAIEDILTKEQVTPSAITLLGAFLSIVVNEMMYRQSICAGTQLKSPSMVANAWEKRSDALSSVAVFIGILGAKLGWHFLDPLAAILVAFYILKFSAEMLWNALKGLIDTAADEKVVEQIRKVTEKVHGVENIKKIRTREVGQNIWIDLDICIDADHQISQATKIKDAVKNSITKEIERQTHVFVYVKPYPS
jgi:cation diffusion facilitator family transporter